MDIGIPENKMNKRTISFSSTSDFPTKLYLNIIDILEEEGYTVKKLNDWIEVSPQSEYFQGLVQKKSNIEQQIKKVMMNLSDMRKQLEMLRHDRRKLERIVEHKEEGDIHTLKSDYVDLVDRNTEMSLLDLANSGKFPSIVVDFYEIETEEDIEDLEVSKGEKEVLRKKWRLFQSWKKRYVSEIEKRYNMVKEEIENKKASIDHYKDMLEPYVKAVNRIKVTEPEGFETLSDPRIIENYSTSVSGVELYCWKAINPDNYEEIPGGVEKNEFYSFLDITINRPRVPEIDLRIIKVEIDPDYQHRSELEEREEEIERREKEILEALGRLKGEIPEEEEEEEENSLKKALSTIKESGRKLLGIPGEAELRNGQEKALAEVVEDETDHIYKRIKEAGGALRLEKLRW